MSVGPLVLRRKALGHDLGLGAPVPAAIGGHGQLVGLTGISQVGVALYRDVCRIVSFIGEHLIEPPLEHGIGSVQLIGAHRVQPAQEGLGELVLDIGEEEPEGAEDAGMRRHESPCHIQ